MLNPNSTVLVGLPPPPGIPSPVSSRASSHCPSPRDEWEIPSQPPPPPTPPPGPPPTSYPLSSPPPPPPPRVSSGNAPPLPPPPPPLPSTIHHPSFDNQMTHYSSGSISPSLLALNVYNQITKEIYNNNIELDPDLQNDYLCGNPPPPNSSSLPSSSSSASWVGQEAIYVHPSSPTPPSCNTPNMEFQSSPYLPGGVRNSPNNNTQYKDNTRTGECSPFRLPSPVIQGQNGGNENNIDNINTRKSLHPLDAFLSLLPKPPSPTPSLISAPPRLVMSPTAISTPSRCSSGGNSGRMSGCEEETGGGRGRRGNYMLDENNDERLPSIVSSLSHAQLSSSDVGVNAGARVRGGDIFEQRHSLHPTLPLPNKTGRRGGLPSVRGGTGEGEGGRGVGDAIVGGEIPGGGVVEPFRSPRDDLITQRMDYWCYTLLKEIKQIQKNCKPPSSFPASFHSQQSYRGGGGYGEGPPSRSSINSGMSLAPSIDKERGIGVGYVGGGDSDGVIFDNSDWRNYDFEEAKKFIQPAQFKCLASVNVIGKLFDVNGDRIRCLQNEHNIRIYTTSNRIFYPGTGKQVLLVKGKLVDILRALRTVYILMLHDVVDVELLPANFDFNCIKLEISVIIPSSTCSKLLSSMGSEIQKMQIKSNARIHVTCMRFEYNNIQERLATIHGRQCEVERALELMALTIQCDSNNNDSYTFLNYPLYTKAYGN